MISSSVIEGMICDILSRVTNESSDLIDRDMSFDRFGLDSLAKAGLLTEISKQLLFKFETIKALDCDSPRELSRFLVRQQNAQVP